MKTNPETAKSKPTSGMNYHDFGRRPVGIGPNAIRIPQARLFVLWAMQEPFRTLDGKLEEPLIRPSRSSKHFQTAKGVGAILGVSAALPSEPRYAASERLAYGEVAPDVELIACGDMYRGIANLVGSMDPIFWEDPLLVVESVRLRLEQMRQSGQDGQVTHEVQKRLPRQYAGTLAMAG